jgi:hypothetical protein
MKRNAAPLLLLLWLAACQSKQLAPSAYMDWFAQHQVEHTVSVQQAGITASLTYLPADWLAVNEAGAENPAQIAAVRKEYEGLEYYRLRVALQSGQGDVLQYEADSPDEYYQRVEYFSFAMQNDLHLLSGRDTLPCKLFHFERNYGAAPYMDFMLGFESKEGNKTDRAVIYDDPVFTQSQIRLSIPAENIQHLPTLKL